MKVYCLIETKHDVFIDVVGVFCKLKEVSKFMEKNFPNAQYFDKKNEYMLSNNRKLILTYVNEYN